MLKENQRLIAAGAALLPLRPKTKRPIDRDWTTLPRQGYETLKKRFANGAAYNIGIRLGEPSKMARGYGMMFDCDIHDESLDDVWAELEERFGKVVHKMPMQKSGSAGASFHLFFLCDEPLPSKMIVRSKHQVRRAKDGKLGPAWTIEMFGTGKQVALAPSIHPDTGNPYRWVREFDPKTIPLIDADVLTPYIFQEEDVHSDEALDLSYEEVREYVMRLPKWMATERDTWIETAMSIKHELGDEGLDIFVEFSKQDMDAFQRKDAETGRSGLRVVKDQYKSLKNHRSRGKLRTMKSVIHDVLEYEHEVSMRDNSDLFDEIDEDEVAADSVAKESPTTGEPPKPLRKAEILADFDEIDAADAPASKIERPKPRKGDPQMSILGAASTEAPEYDWADLLGPEIAGMLMDLSVHLKSPMDYCVCGYLWAIAALIGNSRTIEFHDGFGQPSVFFGIVIGGPSTGKTSPLEFFRKIVREIDGRHRGVWKIAYNRWEDDAEIAKGIEKDWKAQAKAARAKGEEAPARPAGADAPPPPIEPLIYVSDLTPESLGERHLRNPRGVSVHTQEISGFLNRMVNGYSGTNDRSRYLEAYDASPSRISRIGRNNGEVMEIERFATSIVGGMQPDVLMSFGNKNLADDGLVARFLTFWPRKEPRVFTRDRPSHRLKFAYMFSRIYDDLKMEEDRDDPTGFKPVPVPVDREATWHFKEWADKREVREKDALPRLEGVLGKANGLIARMALWARVGRWALHMEDDGPSEFDKGVGTIGLNEIEAAIRFREIYAKPQQLRVFQHTHETEEHKNARHVAEYIVEKRPATVNGSKLRREAGIEGFTSATRAQEMDDVLQFLVTLRWLIPMDDDRKGRGRPSKDYEVNPRVWELLG